MFSFSAPCMAHLPSKIIFLVIQNKVSLVFGDDGDLFETFFFNNFLKQNTGFFYSPYYL